jgi:hypothetical protein
MPLRFVVGAGEEDEGRVAKLSLTKPEKQRLAAALGTTVASEVFAERVVLLEQIALDEYVDWLLSVRRFETAAALDRHRILELFGTVRQEAPTVESLADDLDISESRAASLLSRMRYGDARLIRRLTYVAALAELQRQLASVEAFNNRKDVWVSAETGRAVSEANTAIMLDHDARKEGGSFAGAELAERPSATRTGQEWVASELMWELIIAWIEASVERLGDG